MDRRLFLASSAASLPLAGCLAPRPESVLPARECLVPVNVSPGRVIRTVAGLRPYREEGFVVRAEPLGGKTVVHNYGHGGGGITLSWGSSRLAAQLGLPGHTGAVAVLGAGVMGLSTALLAQEAGFPVTIYTKALPPDTTSNIAGGQIMPFSVYKEGRQTEAFMAQLVAAMDYSWRRFQIMVGDDYGIRWLPTYEQSANLGPSPLDPYFVDAKLLTPAENPFPAEPMQRFVTMYVEVGRYLRQLTRDFELAGGRIVVRELATPAEIGLLPETLVFNCTGLGSLALFGDTGMQPMRGQLAVLLPQPEIQYAYSGQSGYIFPRSDGIVLGGTFERDEWDATPQPPEIARIVESHRRFFAAMRCPA
jgi:glycine/D-amino acid oxidase-like deaminating enzyme